MRAYMRGKMVVISKREAKARREWRIVPVRHVNDAPAARVSGSVINSEKSAHVMNSASSDP